LLPLQHGGGNFWDNTLFPIEIKRRSNPTVRDMKGFSMPDALKSVMIGEAVCCALPGIYCRWVSGIKSSRCGRYR
jgi:hypothetical protein